ncbi:hypothetical protein [Nocardiopsis alborubida]|uniref:Minor tail protein n=1 Tax=Nocardiopsis alborubida TaxID=146802 RepID=A0A7X6MAM1_9ACTN|nr:hypothetical protein [Nocardiopsis alborubida]NKY97848.1 hypothetical protein [Nocardiopsis alborubida]
MSATYTYYVADLLSGEIIGDLPLTGVGFTRVLNAPGTFRGSLPTRDPAVRALAPRRLTEPGRTALYVDRDGVLVWGGIVWTTRYAAADGMLEVSAADFLSYFEHRFVLPHPLSPGVPIAEQPPVRFPAGGGEGVDQLSIAETLIGLAQRPPSADLGIRVRRSGTAPHVPRTATYQPFDLKPVLEALSDLSDAADGFDFVSDVRYVRGVPERSVLFGSPQLGRTGTAHLWEYGAGLVDFVWPVDAADAATRVFARGAGNGAEQLIEYAAAAAPGPRPLPLLESAVAALDISDRSLLRALAEQRRHNLEHPVTLPELTVRADRPPYLGTYRVGDPARVIIDDPFFSGPVDVTTRIVEYEVSPGDDAEEELIRLTVIPVEETP